MALRSSSSKKWAAGIPSSASTSGWRNTSPEGITKRAETAKKQKNTGHYARDL
jgi:hypothetical protein